MKCVFLVLAVCWVYVGATDTATESRFQPVARSLIEQGRTFVHHTVKRLMIILPAIFFKLGVAFTLLILVALGVMTNGVIGFLLLVVGLGSVLARLQDHGRPAPISYVHPVPSVHQVWDRSDSGATERTQNFKPYNDYAAQLNNYYSKYTTANI